MIQLLNHLAAGNIPYSGHVVAAARQNLSPVRAESHGEHRVIMIQLLNHLAAGNIHIRAMLSPQPVRTLVPSGLKATASTVSS